MTVLIREPPTGIQIPGVLWLKASLKKKKKKIYKNMSFSNWITAIFNMTILHMKSDNQPNQWVQLLRRYVTKVPVGETPPTGTPLVM